MEVVSPELVLDEMVVHVALFLLGGVTVAAFVDRGGAATPYITRQHSNRAGWCLMCMFGSLCPDQASGLLKEMGYHVKAQWNYKLPDIRGWKISDVEGGFSIILGTHFGRHHLCGASFIHGWRRCWDMNAISRVGLCLRAGGGRLLCFPSRSGRGETW